MPRHSSVSGLTPTPIEISDVLTMPLALQSLNLNDALGQFEEDLLDLDEALVTQVRCQVRVLGQKCRRTAGALLKVRSRLHVVLGGEAP